MNAVTELACFIVIKAQYEPRCAYGRSLGWIAPELKDAGLTLLEDHTDDERPARTWVGVVDGPTFRHFAKAWRLNDESDRASSCHVTYNSHQAERSYVLDGMNWEIGGESPIICVSLRVFPIRTAMITRSARTGAPRARAPRRR
jgi:hypothetical protein